MMKFRDWTLRSKTFVPLIAISGVVTVMVSWMVSGQMHKQMMERSRATASALTRQVAADRQFYTDSVIAKLTHDKVDYTATDINTYRNQEGAIPLPASFVHGTSAIINSEDGHSVDLRSRWNINPEKGLEDDFQEAAFDSFLATADRNAFEETVATTARGLRYMYVVPDIASAAACVDCHNELEGSAKHDFRFNDVMGALVISLPLEEAMEAKRNTTLLLSGALFAVFGLFLGIIGFIQSRFVIGPLLRMRSSAQKISLGEFDVNVDVESGDEVGELGEAFERMRASLEVMMQESDNDSDGL